MLSGRLFSFLSFCALQPFLQFSGLCLDPQNHFFVQHLNDVHNISNESCLLLFLVFKLVSEQLAFS